VAALPPEVPPGAARRPLLSEPACGLTPVGPADRPDRTHPRARSSTTSARRVVVRVDDRLGAGERIELGLLFGPRADPDRRPRVEPVTRPWAQPHLDPAVLVELAVERPPTLAVLVGLLLQLQITRATEVARPGDERPDSRGSTGGSTRCSNWAHPNTSGQGSREAATPCIHEQPRIAAGLAALPGGVALRPIRDSNIPANRLAFLAAVSPGYAPVETDWH